MVNAYDEFNNPLGVDNEEENSDDFYDYDDDLTGDTVSTEDTEDNSTNIYNDYRRVSAKKSSKPSQLPGSRLIKKSRTNYRHCHQMPHSSSVKDHHHHHKHHKKISNTRQPPAGAGTTCTSIDQLKYAHTKRSLRTTSQNSPGRSKIKSTSKMPASKSQQQAPLPPPILTSTLQLQAHNENYVNLPPQQQVKPIYNQLPIKEIIQSLLNNTNRTATNDSISKVNDTVLEV